MKSVARVYFNNLISNLPVAVFFFTIVFSINLLWLPQGYRLDYGVNAVDELVAIYMFFLVRTIMFSFLVTGYGLVFLSKRLSYKQMIMTHAFLVLTSVGLMFRHPSDSLTGVLYVLGVGVIIYGIIWFFVLYKERNFLSDANDILKENEKAQK